MCTAKDAVTLRFRTGITSTTCTTVIFIDRTKITTTNAYHPATRYMRLMTMCTARDVAMLRSHTGITSTTCTTGAGTPLTATTTTSTEAGAYPARAGKARVLDLCVADIA